MDHFLDKMDHLFDHFRQYCIFSENYWNKIFMREFPYKWIRFEAFLFLFELFQFICELSVLRMCKGQFVHKMYTILYFVFDCSNSEASAWSYCVYAAIAAHTLFAK